MRHESGLTIRAAVFLGFGLVFGLWLFAWYGMSLRIADAQRRAAEINARYLSAQETLSGVRAQVLLGSVVLRDALLNRDPARIGEYRRQIQQTLDGIDALLRRYVTVADSPAALENLRRLRQELDAYRTTMLDVLGSDSSRWQAEAATLLSVQLTPRRDIVLTVSEEVQSLNRSGYIDRQNEIAGAYRLVQRELWELLGLALAIGVGIALLAVFYAGTLERRVRRQLQKDVELTRQLKDLSARLVTAQEEERRQIARELHDEIGQALTAVKMELAHAEQEMDETAGGGRLLADARAITDGALQQVRHLSYLLHPPALDEFGLVAALNSHVNTFSRRYGIRAELIHDTTAERLPLETEAAAYRIVQEALTNVARHSHASSCTVRLAQTPTSLRISVEDDGRGFDLAVAGSAGLGLIGIRERAAHLEGRALFQSTPGRGTCICIELPANSLIAAGSPKGLVPDPAAA